MNDGQFPSQLIIGISGVCPIRMGHVQKLSQSVIRLFHRYIRTIGMTDGLTLPAQCVRVFFRGSAKSVRVGCRKHRLTATVADGIRSLGPCAISQSDKHLSVSLIMLGGHLQVAH